MSNVYNLEPPTRGKVVLHTNLGDLDIELWPKEAPKAVRNFVQLCMEGYYDNTIFHRVIRDYMAQGGDPTGTGTAGESIYGSLFKDEFHQRLKFSHRGLVACANQNEPHTNGSQFFITLDKCDWLDKKNTIFGKVVGDTIYNLQRLNEVDADPDTDRPYEPPVIKSCEVLDNPFPDIVPRRVPAAVKQQQEQEAKRRKDEDAKQYAKAATGSKKNLSLLSFEEEGGDGDEGDVGAFSLAGKKKGGGIRAAHDVLQDARLVRDDDVAPEERIVIPEEAYSRGRGVSEDREPADEGTRSALDKMRAVMAAKRGETRVDDDDENEEDPRGSFADRMRDKVRNQQSKLGSDKPSSKDDSRKRSRSDPDGEGSEPDRHNDRPRHRDDDGSDGGARGDQRSGKSDKHMLSKDAKEDAKDKYNRELGDVKREKRAYGKLQAASVEVADADLLKPWQLQRQMYKKRKQALGRREDVTLARLASFQAKLRAQAGSGSKAEEKQQQTNEDNVSIEQQADKGKDDKGYSGKVDNSIDHKTYMPAAWRVDDYLDGNYEDTSLEDLRDHQLAFAKAPTDKMSRKDDVDDYVVFDPLLEAQKGKSKFSKAMQKEKKRQNEWAGRSNV